MVDKPTLYLFGIILTFLGIFIIIITVVKFPNSKTLGIIFGVLIMLTGLLGVIIAFVSHNREKEIINENEINNEITS